MFGSTFRRIRQFFKTLNARLNQTDLQFVHSNLNKCEQKLFDAMDHSVQKHCVEVAQFIINEQRMQSLPFSKTIIKAALLHDIGKVAGSFYILDRVAYVLGKKFTPRTLAKIARRNTKSQDFVNRFRNALYVNLKHPEIGAELAKKTRLDDQLIYYIYNHHNASLAMHDEILTLLMKADDLC